ncbi:MAG: toxin-antitoxin system YwqK family antitoxin [Bacteroidales bacterium]|nr:toxin-antitoxin system YwqK family antitoxin [Bacteroidales bacterium]
MKSLCFLPVFIFLVSILTVHGQEIKNGYTKLYHPNGKMASEGLMRNGQPDGYWKTYFPTGVLKSEGNRKNHLLDSIWIFYNEAGDTIQKVSYIMGKRNGFTTGYQVLNTQDPLLRGKVISRELFVNDKREGLSLYYYPEGSIREEVQYVNNKRQGITREFDKEGKLITLQRFNNGTLVERERINRSDEQGLKQGVWKSYYPNGRIRSEVNYRDGLLNGPFKEYDENGNVSVLLQYTKGVLIEEQDTAALDIEIRNELDSDGNVVYSGSFRKNVPVGIHRIFDGSGKVVNAFLYNDSGIKLGEGIITSEGKKEGEWKYFNMDGTIRSSGNYSNNLEQGTWKYYFGNGKTEQTGVFKNGRADGLWKWYYVNGGIKREEEYFEGKEEGVSIEYDTLGNIITSGSYFDGQKEGEWIYQAGDYSEKGVYIGDLKDGKWQAFYRDGKLKYEGNFVQGNPDGEHVFYYPNGQIKEINYYVMGISEKNWKKFDENGLLLITITYKDNREYRINGQKVEFAENDIKLIQ